MIFKHFFALAKKSVNAWVDDYAPSMGAAISYYTVFSIAPLLIIVISVAGLVWGREAVQGEIVDQLSGLLGKDAANGVQSLIQSANQPAKGIIATVISVIVLVIGATTVFAELQSALDRIWNVPAAQKSSGIWATLRARLLSLGFILGLGFLLSVSLVLSAGVAAFGSWANGMLPGWETLLHVVNTIVSLGVATLLFAMIFKLMPQAKVSWRDVWVGAVVTALLFEIGKTLIGLYIGKSAVASSFAAAGSLVILLVWVYYSAQIFLLGAEFTWAYAHDHGSLALAGEKTPATAAERDAGETASQSDSNKGDAPHKSQSSGSEPLPQAANPTQATGQRLAASQPVTTQPKPKRPTLGQRAVAYVATHGVMWIASSLLKRYSGHGQHKSRRSH